jgi:hypothetical protein
MRGSHQFIPPFTVYARQEGQPAPHCQPAGAQPHDAQETGGGAYLLMVIERLEETVEQETAVLRSGRKYDLRDFNDRKSHGLLDLSRAIRLLGTADPGETVKSRLAGLRSKLEVNRSVLKMHLDAVREITAIVSEAIRDADSDGTYSISIRNSQTPARNAGLLRNYDL